MLLYKNDYVYHHALEVTHHINLIYLYTHTHTQTYKYMVVTHYDTVLWDEIKVSYKM